MDNTNSHFYIDIDQEITNFYKDKYEHKFPNVIMDLNISKEILNLLYTKYPEIFEKNPIDLIYIFLQSLVYSVDYFMDNEGPFLEESKIELINQILLNLRKEFLENSIALHEKEEKEGKHT